MTEPLAGPARALDAAVADVAARRRGRRRRRRSTVPRQAEHGDYATNAAMLLTKRLGRRRARSRSGSPAALGEHLGASLTSADVAGPGFLNLVLDDAWYAARARATSSSAGEAGAAAGPSPR